MDLGRWWIEQESSVGNCQLSSFPKPVSLEWEIPRTRRESLGVSKRCQAHTTSIWSIVHTASDLKATVGCQGKWLSLWRAKHDYPSFGSGMSWRQHHGDMAEKKLPGASMGSFYIYCSSLGKVLVKNTLKVIYEPLLSHSKCYKQCDICQHVP